MDNFHKALAATLTWEGGYVNNPSDHGGATMRGITQAVYDAYLRSIGANPHSVKEIRDEEVELIYKRNYWDVCECDSLPWPLAFVVFDCAVNSGPSRSIKLLQGACPGLAIDGVVGPKTLEAAKTVDPVLVVNAREAVVRRIVARDATQAKFLGGWLNRIAAVRTVASTSK
jgi:lysozyme family protein